MNKKELERKLIEVTREKNNLQELILTDYLSKIQILEQKINLITDENLELKMKNLIEENKELRKSNKELINEITELKYIKKKCEKKTSRINYKEYNIFRKQILERDNYTCQECGSKNKLQVHHIKSRKKFPQLIMDKNNCITLCISCHAKTENYFC